MRVQQISCFLASPGSQCYIKQTSLTPLVEAFEDSVKTRANQTSICCGGEFSFAVLAWQSIFLILSLIHAVVFFITDRFPRLNLRLSYPRRPLPLLLQQLL